MAKKIPSKISKPQSLRVLIVEDSEDDALLIIRELKKGGYNPVYERVETAAAMKKALKEKKWGIILCDYKLPKFSGIKAITLLKETNIDIPIFIVSGAIGEETAVECMRLGAHDYIMKNNLSRLCLAITRELKEAEVRNKQKQAEEALRQSEEKYRTILENIEDGYYEVALNGNFTFFNASMCRILGYPQKEMMGMNNRQFTDKENAKKLFKTFNEVYRTGQTTKAFDWQIIRKDGTERYIEVSVSLQKNSSGKPIGFRGVARDITERKQAEEALRESHQLLEKTLASLRDAVFIIDAKTTAITDCNPAATEIFGYSREDMLGRATNFLHVDQAALEEFRKHLLSAVAEKGFLFLSEFKMKRKDGTAFPTEHTVMPLGDEQGRQVGWVSVVHDITERKRMEEALLENEKRYRLIAENSADQISILDMNLHFTYVSPAIMRLRGLTVDEAMEQTLEQVLTPESMRLGLTVFEEEMQLEVSGTADPDRIRILELEEYKKDGSIIWVEVSFTFLRDKDSKPIEILMVSRDVTKRKQMEKVLQTSEEKYRNILENMQEGYFELDLAGNFTFVNEAECRNLGYPREELIGMNNRHYQDETTAQKTYQLFIRLYRTGEPVKASDVEIIKKNGTKGFNEISVSLIRDAEGKPIGFRGISRDITERKQAEEALRVSEARYRLLADNMTDTIWLMDMNLNVTYNSPSVAKKRGYTDEEIKQLPPERHVTPESFNNAMTAFSEEMEKLKADPSYLFERTLELEFCRKDGTKFWSENTFSLIRDENGIPVSILGEGRDITERKQAEDALRQSEEKYRNIIENMQEGYFENDLAGNFIFVNDALCGLLGYSREELIGKNSRQYTDEKTAKKIYQTYNKIYRTGEPSRGVEEEYFRKDGIRVFAELSVSLIRDAEDKPIGFRGIARDITERKQAESQRETAIEALRKSETQYRLLADHIKDHVWLMDLNLKPTYISPSVEKSRGYTFEEFAELPLDKHLTAASLQSAMEFFSIEMPKALADPTYYMTRSLDLEFYRKDGSTYWMENTFTLIRDENGKPLSLLGAGRDITERKQADKERKQSFERMRKALGATVQAISITVEMKDPYTSGHQRRVSDLARSMAGEMGLSADRQDFIRTASSIHDIGKISIPTEILSKPTKLTELEFSLIKTHSQSGYDILKDIKFPWPVANVVLQHHERMDGSGYPQGIKGDDILLEARILAVADVVEAIASHRPYRPAMGIDLALKEISDNKGILFDAAAVDACLKLFREKGYALVLKK